jgi:hypothetical protein
MRMDDLWGREKWEWKKKPKALDWGVGKEAKVRGKPESQRDREQISTE